MAIQLQLANGSLVGGGGAAFLGANVHPKPIDHGTLGHYRMATTVVLVAAQAANSRLFELRNAGSHLIIPTKLELSVMPFGSVAVPYLFYALCYKCTSFTAVDTTNATTPSIATMRTGMAAAPGGADVRYLGGAGNASGMTGGTLTKVGLPISMMMARMASVSADSHPVVKDFLAGLVNGMHQPVFAQNEGFIVENGLLGSATSNEVIVLLDIAWAEVPTNGY